MSDEKPRILIMEDIRVVGSALDRALAIAGYETMTTDDKWTVMAECEMRPVALVVVDIRARRRPCRRLAADKASSSAREPFPEMLRLRRTP